MNKILAYTNILIYTINIQGLLRPKRTGTPRQIAATLLVSMLAVTPVKAGETGHPTEGLFVMVGTMYGCSQAARSDLSSHCYMGLVGGTWATIFTKNPWIGTAVGCLLGAAKEGYDRNNNGTAAWDDFAYTCGAAAISAYGTDSIIKLYKIRNTPVIGVQKRF